MVILLSLIFLAGCSPLVPRVPVCGPINESKGLCIFTVGDGEFEVNNEEWKKLKDNSLILPLASWAEIKKFLLEVCTRYENCPKKEVEKKIELLSL